VHDPAPGSAAGCFRIKPSCTHQGFRNHPSASVHSFGPVPRRFDLNVRIIKIIVEANLHFQLSGARPLPRAGRRCRREFGERQSDLDVAATIVYAADLSPYPWRVPSGSPLSARRSPHTLWRSNSPGRLVPLASLQRRSSGCAYSLQMHSPRSRFSYTNRKVPFPLCSSSWRANSPRPVRNAGRA